jgi:NAD(P)-dependent dehydrogenase (short-subunit alcohol dehydrogenase family)
LETSLLKSDAPLVVMMSSDLGSIENNEQGQSYAYRSSKSALNMITKGLSVEFKDQGVRVISMAPGWTQTDLGGVNALWKVEGSVANQIKTLTGLGASDSGVFINLLGEKVPW